MARKKKAPVRSKKQIVNDNRNINNIEQYLLNQNLDKTSRFFSSNPDKFNHLTFRQVKGQGHNIINKLRGIDNINVFYKIKNSVLSLMQPKIKLYKVFHTDFKTNPDGTVVEGSVQPLRRPCYKEFKFSDNFGQETADTVADYLAYESTKPTYRNVGLKVFSLKYNGENFGTIENNIECQLVISLKSLKDLEASPPGSPGLRYLDLLVYPPAKFNHTTETINPMYYELKALMGYTAPTVDQLTNLNLTAEDIRNVSQIEKLNMIVKLGMHDYSIDIKDNGMVNVTITYRGSLETVIGTNQVNIFQDSIRISKSGAVSLSKNINPKHNMSLMYRLLGSIRAIHKELNEAGCKDEKCQSRKKLISLLEKDSVFSKMYLDAGGQGLTSRGGKHKVVNQDEAFEWMKDTDNVDVLIAKFRQKIGAFKKDVFRTFMDQIIDGNLDDENSPGTRLFCLEAGKDAVKKAAGSDIIYDESRASGGQRGIDKAKLTAGAAATDTTSSDALNYSITVGSADSPLFAGATATVEAKANVAAQIATELEEESDSKDKPKKEKKKKDKKKEQMKQTTLKFDGQSYKFYYVYLGDIIELACKNAGISKIKFDDMSGQSVYPNKSYYDEEHTGIDYPLKNSRVLLGPMEYLDDKGKTKIINLAEYPISFNYFRAWFIKTIIRRQQQQKSLGSFIASLIKELVLPGLGYDMPKSIKPPGTRFNITAMTLPGKQEASGGNNNQLCDSQSNIKEILPKKKILDLDSAEFHESYFKKVNQPISSESLIKTSLEYLLIYLTANKGLKDRKGDPAKDVKDGIYHFNIGSDMGLLKKMSFKRQTIPHFAEMKSLASIEQGVDPIQQLKLPHDTNLSLIGNSLFTPGMYCYINPSMLGLGSIEVAGSLAYHMHLGGYHIIQEVKSTIMPGKYETTLIAQQLEQGKR